MRGRVCPFCATACVHEPRIDLGRVARSTLFAVGAVALYDCGSSVPFYGFPCLDACSGPDDASSTNDGFQFNVDVVTPPPDAADVDSDASDADEDVLTDAPDEASD